MISRSGGERVKSKLCVGKKIWPRHTQRLDASCTPGELWRREPGRSHTENPQKWDVEQSMQQNWGWTGKGQQGQTALRLLSVSMTLSLIVEWPLETPKGASESMAGYEGPEQQTALRASWQKSY